MSQILEASWWIDSCSALSSVLESLISLCEIDRGISLILIGDKHSMISLIQLLALQPPSGIIKLKNYHSLLKGLM